LLIIVSDTTPLFSGAVLCDPLKEHVMYFKMF